MMLHTRIERNPDIMFGKPVIKGTRITVELILRKLSAGKTFDEILAAHPHLTIEDLYAAAAFAADYLAQEEIVFTNSLLFDEYLLDNHLGLMHASL